MVGRDRIIAKKRMKRVKRRWKNSAIMY